MPEILFSISYIESDTELEALIGADPRTSAVALKTLAAEFQAWYCQEATRKIDSLPLRGQKWDMTSSNGTAVQILEFPRLIDGVGVGNGIDYDLIPEVPDNVKRACLEEAIWILQHGNDQRLDNQQTGVASQSIAGSSESYVPGFGLQILHSPRARQIMRLYTGVECR
jgi:hypothetical protein